MELIQASAPIKALATIETLKNTRRRGWVFRGVPDPESVADHMYQMWWICQLFPWQSEEDRQRASNMCLVHDAPESIAGDIIPSDGISRETKRIREELGLDFLVCLIKPSSSAFADKLESLWNGYEERLSHVSLIVHQIDKLEALLQAFIYTRRHPEVDLSDFKKHREEITDPWLAEQADAILKEWDAFRPASDMAIVFIIGGPGVGKGTQCAEAADELGMEHISVGELLRTERDSLDSDFRDFIADSFEHNVAVPATLTMTLLEKRLERARSQQKNGILLDGFPKSRSQLEAFEEQVSNKYSTVVMECSDDILFKRLGNRALSSSREDDNPASIKKRVDTFRGSIDQLKPLLSGSENAFHTVCCEGSIDEVKELFQGTLRDILGINGN